jgi:hypothetical protein
VRKSSPLLRYGAERLRGQESRTAHVGRIGGPLSNTCGGNSPRRWSAASTAPNRKLSTNPLSMPPIWSNKAVVVQIMPGLRFEDQFVMERRRPCSLPRPRHPSSRMANEKQLSEMCSHRFANPIMPHNQDAPRSVSWGAQATYILRSYKYKATLGHTVPVLSVSILFRNGPFKATFLLPNLLLIDFMTSTG